MLKFFTLILFLLLSAAANCAAAGNEGASGGQFLRIGVDARSAALGESASTLTGAQAIFYNPAGLSGVTRSELYFSQVQWILDTNYSNLAFAKRAGGGVYGLAVSYLSAPPTDRYDKFGAKLSGTYTAADMAVTLGYARRIAGGTDLGLNVKHISSRLDTESAAALAVDAGIKCAAIPGKLDLGFVLQNAGGKLNYINDGDALPLNLKLGGQYTVSLGRDRLVKKDLAFFTDLNHMRDSGAYANFGAELLTAYSTGSAFSLRGGYRTNAGGKSAGVSAGLGLDMGSYLIEYAYAPMGDLGNTHRFSLTVKFGVKPGRPARR